MCFVWISEQTAIISVTAFTDRYLRFALFWDFTQIALYYDRIL